MEKGVIKLVIFNGEDFFFFCERRGFRLLEKPKSQLSLELGSCHLGDRAGDICDPGYTRQRDPMCAIKV
jgi:hypothetical protein